MQLRALASLGRFFFSLVFFVCSSGLIFAVGDLVWGLWVHPPDRRPIQFCTKFTANRFCASPHTSHLALFRFFFSIYIRMYCWCMASVEGDDPLDTQEREKKKCNVFVWHEIDDTFFVACNCIGWTCSQHRSPWPGFRYLFQADIGLISKWPSMNCIGSTAIHPVLLLKYLPIYFVFISW